MKVDQELKNKWLEALRSGDFEQSSSQLVYQNSYGQDSFCCLGVLCEISPEARRTTDGNAFIIARHRRNNYVTINGKMKLSKRLAEFNDSGMEFSEIADVIEKELEV